MYLIGYDIGSSSVKACLLEAETGKIIASDFYPKEEMDIHAPQAGWAEQDPEEWWKNLKLAHASVLRKAGAKGKDIEAVGITWQMHGLVLIDKNDKVLRPAIIWCDSRAVNYGQKAFESIGKEKCLSQLLNSPGNFTAAKLAWVKDNEPEIYEKIDKILLPGDYIALKLSGERGITVEGLSEGIFWDFKNRCISKDIMEYFGIEENLFPPIVPIFGEQARISLRAARELDLQEGTPISYRAGDQPNNALSLNVFNPGEIASTAGTSGVVYGVSDELKYDPQSRVNTFAHVNYKKDKTRVGILLCINGTGILYSWIRKNLMPGGISYPEMNERAARSTIGSGGISVIPFGNGAERVIGNKETNCSIHGINFNLHTRNDLLRAAQEGIVFSYQYGMEIMKTMGMDIRLIRAGNANMFLSPVFCRTLASLSGASIELFDTDGAAGAARAAGLGCGFYSSLAEAFSFLKRINRIDPDVQKREEYVSAYEKWKNILLKHIF